MKQPVFQFIRLFPGNIFFDPLIASLQTPTRFSGATIYTQVHFARRSAIEDITLHTLKPLTRLMKASFNPLLADRILSTTVPIKVRCSSETDACCSMPVIVSGAPGSLGAAAGVQTPFERICLPDSRVVPGCKSDSLGPLLLVPIGSACPGLCSAEVSPSSVVFI